MRTGKKCAKFGEMQGKHSSVYLGGMQAVHVSRQKKCREFRFLGVGGARDNPPVISGEVRTGVKMVPKCSLALERFGVLAVVFGAFFSHSEVV